MVLLSSSLIGANSRRILSTDLKNSHLGYSLRGFAVKVELLSSSDAHIRYVPAAMVDAGHAEIAHQNGKVRSIGLIATAATHVRMNPSSAAGALLMVYETRRAPGMLTFADSCSGLFGSGVLRTIYAPLDGLTR